MPDANPIEKPVEQGDDPGAGEDTPVTDALAQPRA